MRHTTFGMDKVEAAEIAAERKADTRIAVFKPGRRFHKGVADAKKMGCTFDRGRKVWTIPVAEIHESQDPENMTRHYSDLVFLGLEEPGKPRSSTGGRAKESRVPEGCTTVYRSTAPYLEGYGLTFRDREGWYTIVACGTYRVSEVEDDTREGETAYWAHVRPATEDEAAKHQARRDEREVKTARKAELTEALRASYTGVPQEEDPRTQQVPAGSKSIWQEARMAGSETWYEAPDGTIWHVRSDYDMGPVTWRTTATREQIDEAKALGLRPGLV